MKSITLHILTCLMVGSLFSALTISPVQADEQASTSANTGSSEGIASPSDSSGGVQERAVKRDFRTQKQLKQTAPAAGTTGPAPVVGGGGQTILEPDYRYPWMVRTTGYACGGVLIDPQWVLTAAHCVTPNIGFGKFTYIRTDPYTGAVTSETLRPDPYAGPSNNRGVFIHPNYAPSNDQANDIALVKVEKPFTINPYIQTVGLPFDFRHSGMTGTLASIDHLRTLPSGQTAIFRAPIPQDTYPPKFNITAGAANASLCPGDSGSGFVTVEYGRATVRGVASQGTISDCMTATGEATFTDVFNYRGWILQTIGKSNTTVLGNTRLRWSGSASRGTLVVACSNPNGNLVGPLNVVGVEEGAVCEPNQTQTIMCTLDKNQPSTKFGTPQLVGFSMRTTTSNGTSQVQSLPISGNLASFFGLLPAGTSREFTCQVASGLTATTGALTDTNLTIMSRGIEGEEHGAPTIVQPSPFDPSEGTKP